MEGLNPFTYYSVLFYERARLLSSLPFLINKKEKFKAGTLERELIDYSVFKFYIYWSITNVFFGESNVASILRFHKDKTSHRL